MKKFLTLALALVMVFAISSTAFAAGWGDIYVAPTYDEIEMKLEALSLKRNATAIFNAYEAYTVLSVNYPVVEDTDVHAGVTIKVPDKDDLSPQTLEYMKNEQVKLRLDFSNFAAHDVNPMVTVSYDGNYTVGVVDIDEDGGYIILPEQLTDGADYVYVEIWGKADSDKTDVVIEAQIGIFNEWFDGVTDELDEITNFVATRDGNPNTTNIAAAATASNAEFFTFYSDKTDEYYTVAHVPGSNSVSGSSGYFDVVNADADNLYGFRFYYRNSNRGILDVHPGAVLEEYDFETGAADVYMVTDAHQAASTYAFVYTNTSGVSTHYHSSRNSSTYNRLVSELEEIHEALGFAYDGTDYMHPDHYDLYFGIHDYYVEEEVWPSGYVAELIVDDPSVNPPQTGDNASIAGFVMIAIALVAAAAVTIKKVRA